MYFTGFADEVSADIDIQLKVTKELGWSNIETRDISGKNLASLSDAEFETVAGKIADAGVKFNCFGSGIANWSKPITESPESSYQELRNAIPRLQRLGTKLVRIMSFAVAKELKPRSWEFEAEVIKRLKVLVKMAEDAGIVLVHENCANWGGLSYEHTLKLVESIQSPSFKLVFDTGNPVFNEDVRGAAPYKMGQSSWEFYKNVRDYVVYIHIKDAKLDKEGKPGYCYPGEGAGDVLKIVKDLFARGYDGGVSIEPHMVHVFHNPSNDLDKKLKFAYENYIEYGKRMEKMIASVKKA